MTKTVSFDPKSKKSTESAIEKILVAQAVSKGLQDKKEGKVFSHEAVKRRKKHA